METNLEHETEFRADTRVTMDSLWFAGHQGLKHKMETIL